MFFGLSGKTQTMFGAVKEIPIVGLDNLGVESPHQYAEGRVCRHVGRDARECGTVLCIYNPGPKCFKHTPPRFFNTADRRHKENILRKQKERR